LRRELDGFYSPTADADTNELYIRYRFLDKMHECIVGEMEELRMPVQGESKGLLLVACWCM
jgi:hypothetical protein